MRVDLAGLLKNAADVVEHPRRHQQTWKAIAFGLREAAGHVEQVREGKATLVEFCDLYRLTEPPQEGGS